MSGRFLIICLTIVLILLSSTILSGQGNPFIIFQDDYESFIPGQQLVCQDSINWNTWSSIPCDTTEDPYVTNALAYSGANSVWLQQNNDLIKPIPDYTEGKYRISFYLYVPSGYTAGWLQEAEFNAGNYKVGFYARFDTAGIGNINAGGYWTAVFPYEYNTWMRNELIIDLGNDWAEFYFEDNLIYGWKWSLGADSTGCPLQISVTDFWGGIAPNTGPSQFYLDDYVIERLDTALAIKDFTMPTKYNLEQNYPNPFNPSTKIKYSVPQTSQVRIKVFDVLGNEIETLVNKENPAGTYEINWNALNLPSGVYFYQLRAGKFVETKKMVLLR